MSSQGLQNFSRVKLLESSSWKICYKTKIDTGEILEALELASKLGKNYFEIVDLETMDVLRKCVTILCWLCKIS